MVNMGCWTWADPMLSDHLQAFGDIHEHAGFHAFQSMVASLSFKPDYYNANREKLLGSGGVWGALEGRIQTHLRFVQACRGHDIRPHLGEIEAPTLVIHAGEDIITGPRTTKPLEEGLRNSVGVTMDDVAHVVAGKEEKIAFGKILFDFLGAH
jgi:pimeloyl-ACP methyl ester carboxylesterase